MTAASSRSFSAHGVSVSVIGLSYKTAPLDVRERLAFDTPELPAILASLRRIPAIRECVLLSTCNRTETYVASSGEVAVTDVLHALGEQRNLPPAALESGIARGELAPGDQLPPVRTLAAGLSVSPATVAAAYRSLKRRGFVVADRKRADASEERERAAREKKQ